MSLADEAGVLLAYAMGMLALFAVMSVLIVPMKFIMKLLLSSMLGGAAIALLNAAGSFLGIHVCLNAVTAAVTGIMGVPGLVMVMMLQWIL